MRHGVMFHHFHSNDHPCGQGSICAQDLENMIHFLGRDNILNPEQWIDRATRNLLTETDICFTFDDTLRCQYEIALPILERHNIRAFWFVYTSVLDGQPEKLEIYRYFRTVKFKDFNAFFESFMATLNRSSYVNRIQQALASFDERTYLTQFPFYSKNDKQFRFLRDKVLGSESYNKIMDRMIKESNFDTDSVQRNLWMDVECIKTLSLKGHVIGLHSHTHPTQLESLSDFDQQKEYETNLSHIVRITNQHPVVMSHPCNSYNETTLKILRGLGVKIGFCSNMKRSKFESELEIPREDHANIISEMRK